MVELKDYVGGTRDGYWHVGGTPPNNAYNIYSLTTSAPAQTYYVNAGSQRDVCYAIDITRTIRVNGGAIVRLVANTGTDSFEVINRDALGQPIVVPDVPPAPASYDGQFVQMDVVSVTLVP